MPTFVVMPTESRDFPKELDSFKAVEIGAFVWEFVEIEEIVDIVDA